MLPLALTVENTTSVGDLIVGAGTLLLAWFTWRLARATRKSIRAGEEAALAASDSAEATHRAADAALLSVEVEREGVAAARAAADAARAQVEAISIPFVVPVPDPHHQSEAARESLKEVLPIHRARLGGGTYIRLRLLNIGSGPAVVTAVQFRESVDLLIPLGRAYPLAATDGSEDVDLMTTNTWPPNP